MFYVSDIKTEPPVEFKTELQRLVYSALGAAGIAFERVDTDEAITMEDCTAIDGKLDMKMVKTLFLCDRKRTEFYLFVTAGDKPFSSKDFSAALGVSRVSFAPSELMESLLGTKIGAATVFSVLLASAAEVRLVFDRSVLNEEFYGCSDGTTTGYMKLYTEDVTGRLMSYADREFETIEV